MRSLLIAAGFVTLLAVRADADFDLSPAIGPGNKIVVNAFQDADEAFVSNVRVFGFAFGEVPDQPYFLSDPGFHPLPDTSGFAPGSSIGIDLAAPLRFWSGTGSPSFAPVASGTTIRFDFGASTVVSGGGVVPTPAGYGFAVVDSNGEADDHLETYLLASGGTIANPGTPATGIYLVTLNVTSSTRGVLASDPAYLLFSNGVDDDAFDTALLYSRDSFAPGSNLTPEPATAVLLVSASTQLLRRRR